MPASASSLPLPREPPRRAVSEPANSSAPVPLAAACTIPMRRTRSLAIVVSA